MSPAPCDLLSALRVLDLIYSEDTRSVIVELGQVSFVCGEYSMVIVCVRVDVRVCVCVRLGVYSEDLRFNNCSSTAILTSLNSHPSTSPTPSIMLPIRHCRCGSDSCVWSAPADSSELCLPRGPCHKRCKHIQSAAYSVRLSVSAAYSLSVSILKFNQPSIAPFILVR